MEWVNEALGTESFLQGGPGSSGWSPVSTSLLLPAQEYFFILIFIRSLSFVVLYKTLLGLLGPGLVWVWHINAEPVVSPASHLCVTLRPCYMPSLIHFLSKGLQAPAVSLGRLSIPATGQVFPGPRWEKRSAAMCQVQSCMLWGQMSCDPDSSGSVLSAFRRKDHQCVYVWHVVCVCYLWSGVECVWCVCHIYDSHSICVCCMHCVCLCVIYVDNMWYKCSLSGVYIWWVCRSYMIHALCSICI